MNPDLLVWKHMSEIRQNDVSTRWETMSKVRSDYKWRPYQALIHHTTRQIPFSLLALENDSNIIEGDGILMSLINDEYRKI